MLNGCGANSSPNNCCEMPEHDTSSDPHFDRACGHHNGGNDGVREHHHHHHGADSAHGHGHDGAGMHHHHGHDGAGRSNGRGSDCGPMYGGGSQAGFGGGPAGYPGGGPSGYPGGATGNTPSADPSAAPTLSGDIEADTSKLEDMVNQGTDSPTLQSFATSVANEAKSQGDNPHYDFANNIAKGLADGSLSQAGTQKAFDALPTSSATVTNGKHSAADTNFASKDNAAYTQFQHDMTSYNKKGVVHDLQEAIKNGDLSKADAATLIGETGMDFHKDTPVWGSGTSRGADDIAAQKYNG